jgi:hypothetical protein
MREWDECHSCKENIWYGGAKQSSSRRKRVVARTVGPKHWQNRDLSVQPFVLMMYGTHCGAACSVYSLIFLALFQPRPTRSNSTDAWDCNSAHSSANTNCRLPHGQPSVCDPLLIASTSRALKVASIRPTSTITAIAQAPPICHPLKLWLLLDLSQMFANPH